MFKAFIFQSFQIQFNLFKSGCLYIAQIRLRVWSSDSFFVLDSMVCKKITGKYHIVAVI